MTKICEVCRKDVKQPPSKRGLPLIYVMYSSMDVAIIEDGSEQHIYTHTDEVYLPQMSHRKQSPMAPNVERE